MSTQIFYGGNNVSISGQPIPNVGISDSMLRFSEARWAAQENISLQGQITGCSYSKIRAAQLALLNLFGQDHQPLQIIENGSVVFSSNYCTIESIEFPESRMFGISPYVVSIKTLPPELFSGYYGVLNPSNEWSYQTTDNGLLDITHTISAVGFDTSSGYSNALNNARNYVYQNTGLSTYSQPLLLSFFSGSGNGTPVLLEQGEVINRWDGSYKVTEKWISDIYSAGTGYTRWQGNYDCDITRGVTTLSINGDVKGSRYYDMSVLRSTYQNFNIWGNALNVYSGIAGSTGLNPWYLTSGVTEDWFSRRINFNVTFDNLQEPQTYFDYNSDIKDSENDVITVLIQGAIKGRGDLKTRWQNVQNYYQTLNLFNLASGAYQEFNNDLGFPLNPNVIDSSVNFNQFVGEINISQSFNNISIPGAPFNYLDYTFSYKPAVEQVRALPLVVSGSICPGQWYLSDLGLVNRAEFGIKGSARGMCNSNTNTMVTSIKQFADLSMLQTFGFTIPNQILLQENSVTVGNFDQGLAVGFNFQWSFLSDQFVTTPGQYSGVNSLSIY